MLVYTSEAMTGGVLPVNVNVDLTGVTKVKMEIKPDISNISDKLKVGFLNAEFVKNYTPLE
ncbi:MAG: hypothetical protein IJ167_01005 [Lachnospiraceae bacterium]|nr:hypothetical protein [Lachnospiraceae bacterium]